MLFRACVADHAIFTGEGLDGVLNLVATFHDPCRDVTIWRGNRLEAVVTGNGFLLLLPPVALKVQSPPTHPSPQGVHP
jgi:hypothetical protein